MDGIYGQEGFPYCESFEERLTNDRTVLGGDAVLIPGADDNAGVLRLTDNTTFQNGFFYFDIPFPSSFGLKVSFEYFSYGSDEGADGLAFFMFDAAVTNFQIGGFGGSLGYTQRTERQEAGLAGAYIGIGLDEYGNFSYPFEGRIGGPGFRPNSVVVRGPGHGFDGYQYVIGRRTSQAGTGGLPIEDQFPISSGGNNTDRVIDPDRPGYRQVFINLEPVENGVGFLLSMDMLVTTVPNEARMVNIFDKIPYSFQAPENLKLGFSASTGSLTNFHEIRNVVVEVSNQENLSNPEASDVIWEVCEGKETILEFSSNELLLPNENSSISCIRFFNSREEAEEEGEDSVCGQNACDSGEIEIQFENGEISTEGSFVIFKAQDGTAGNSTNLFYRVTDNYGKTSNVAALQINTEHIPSAPELVILSSDTNDEEIETSSLRICEGDQVVLEAGTGEETAEFSWFYDNELIEDQSNNTITVSKAGKYKVRITTAIDCFVESDEVELLIPPIPELNVEEKAVSCGEGFVDLRLFIADYEDSLFDYEASDLNGNLYLNDELGEINEAGVFWIRYKWKDLDCWSEDYVLEVIITEYDLIPDFTFFVEGVNDFDVEEMDIFTNEVIQFEDNSSDEAVRWFWDFGDGTGSEEKHPGHAYEQTGVYEVSLTVLDEYDCSFSLSKTVEVIASYRIMYPNAFTPEGNENQFFKPKFKGLASLKLYVFNTWGDLIYFSDQMNDQGWDGKKDGELQPNGSYVYKTEYTSTEGERFSDSGVFTLIR